MSASTVGPVLHERAAPHGRPTVVIASAQVAARRARHRDITASR
jgi:hypothetical protein